MRAVKDVEQEQEKKCFRRSNYGPSCKIGEKNFTFQPNGKKRKTRKLVSFYRGHYTILMLYNQIEFQGR